MNLEHYIETLKIKTKNFNELEIIRYVYIDLGMQMSFDLNFAFSKEEIKDKIYRNCFYNINKLDECYKNKTIICKSLSYLLEYILKNLGINITTIVDDEINGYNHIYNIIRLTDGTSFSVDLQRDLENIQAHLKTRHFGLSTNKKTEIINNEILKNIDLKIGYIKKDKNYSDEYYYLMKTITDSFVNLSDKITFVLNNIDPYDDYASMKYAEQRWHFINNLYLYLNEKEKRKVNIFDMYYLVEHEKSYVLAFIIDTQISHKKIFLYNEELQKFEPLSKEEFINKLKNGLHSVRTLPKKFTKSIKNKRH